MSNHNTLKRQWRIIEFFIHHDNYVSSQDIKDYLNQKYHFDVDLRTVQRDLQALSEQFPLECNKKDKPYSWRWQRSDYTQSTQLTPKQAILFTLIESELAHILSPDIMNGLKPLITKSRYLLAGIDYNHNILSDINNSGDVSASHPNKSKPANFNQAPFDWGSTAKTDSSWNLLAKFFGKIHNTKDTSDNQELSSLLLLEKELNNIHLNELANEVANYRKRSFN